MGTCTNTKSAGHRKDSCDSQFGPALQYLKHSALEAKLCICNCEINLLETKSVCNSVVHTVITSLSLQVVVLASLVRKRFPAQILADIRHLDCDLALISACIGAGQMGSDANGVRRKWDRTDLTSLSGYALYL